MLLPKEVAEFSEDAAACKCAIFASEKIPVIIPICSKIRPYPNQCFEDLVRGHHFLPIVKDQPHVCLAQAVRKHGM